MPTFYTVFFYGRHTVDIGAHLPLSVLLRSYHSYFFLLIQTRSTIFTYAKNVTIHSRGKIV
jgi:hypothetical protein